MEKLCSVEQRTKASSSIFENESDDEESCILKENQRSKTIYKEKINKDEEKLFMEIVTWEDHSEMEGVVDLKAELMSALEELKKNRTKNNYLEEKLSKFQEEQKSKHKESSQIIIDLKN